MKVKSGVLLLSILLIIVVVLFIFYVSPTYENTLRNERMKECCLYYGEGYHTEDIESISVVVCDDNDATIDCWMLI